MSAEAVFHACDALCPFNAKARRQARPGSVQVVRWRRWRTGGRGCGCKLKALAIRHFCAADPGSNHVA